MKSQSKIIGVLFLIAMFSSLVGGGVLETVLSIPEYLINLSSNEKVLKVGVLLEATNAIAVVGIGMLLFPVLKKHCELCAAGYVSFRILETISCFAAAIIPLFLLMLGYNVVNAEIQDFSSMEILGNFLLATRADVAGILIPVFFSIGALLFYLLMYRTKLLPRFISLWGLIGVVFIIVLNLLTLKPIASMTLALPIILNEIFLGIWLIVKGFNPVYAKGFRNES